MQAADPSEVSVVSDIKAGPYVQFIPCPTPSLSLRMTEPESLWKEYSTPSPSAYYSESYFHTITFDRVLRTPYPSILPRWSVQSFRWYDDIPVSSAATLVSPSEAIPHILDLQPILDQMRERFQLGQYSVELFYCDDLGSYSHTYHFSKVCFDFFVSD
jgi:hypothetical protein